MGIRTSPRRKATPVPAVFAAPVSSVPAYAPGASTVRLPASHGSARLLGCTVRICQGLRTVRTVFVPRIRALSPAAPHPSGPVGAGVRPRPARPPGVAAAFRVRAVLARVREKVHGPAARRGFPGRPV
ncbi:hypothetical protein ACFSL4_03970 [Streptomyces caeni]|uniref:Uncharacterized protein n=1 Tax=Streptomyces caeni TaxID=2307231 RepID=A0ABW4ILK9_9ACTN